MTSAVHLLVNKGGQPFSEIDVAGRHEALELVIRDPIATIGKA
jgi:hypothetical protein